MKLTIGMMVKNESKYLEECLRSLELLREEVDSELVIVDTGSNDNTLEIAKKYADRVYFHQWNNNFAEMRNVVIDYARGDWLFIIDGDEIVENPEGIIDFFMLDQEVKYNSALLIVKNYSKLEEDQYTLLAAPRLFQNDEDLHYEGVVHDQPVYKKPVCKLNTTLKHYGYLLADRENIERKFKGTATILRSELKKDPENIYYWFQLSKCYGMCKEYNKAFETIQQAVEIAGKKNIKLDDKMYLYIQLAKIQILTGKYHGAEETCQKALQVKDGYVDIYYYLALSQFVINKSEESLENFLQYINLVINFEKSAGYLDSSVDNETVNLINGSYIYVVILCEKLNKYLEALEYIDKIEADKDIEKVLDKIIKIHLKLEEYDRLKNYYDTKIRYSILRDEFLNSLEKYQSESENFKRYELTKAFSKGSGDYSLLNKVRIAIENNEYQDQDLIRLIKRMNFNKLPVYYGDILYYMVLSKQSVARVAPDIRQGVLKADLEYLIGKYDNTGETIYSYWLNEDKSRDLKLLRIRKVIESQLLLSNDLSDKQYENIFKQYIEDGSNYLVNLYSTNILENESIDALKSEEEVFLLYIYHALYYKEKDKQNYKKYLNKALEAYSVMGKGIEILLDESELDESKMESSSKIDNVIGEKSNNTGVNGYQLKKVLFIQSIPDIRTHKVAAVLKEKEITVDLVYLLNPDKVYTGLQISYSNMYKLENVQEMVDFINQSDYDILYSSNEPDYLTAIFTCTNKPIVHDCHDMMSLRGDLSNEQIALEYIANLQSDANIYVTPMIKELAVKKFNLYNKAILCLNNYIERKMLPEEFYPKLSLQDNEIHCVYEGGLTSKESHHRYLEDVFFKLAAEKIHIHLYSSGTLEYFNKLQKSSYIHWEGTTAPDQLLTELTKYDFGLATFNVTKRNRKFLNTTFPNKIWDYLGAGLPVLISDLAAMKKFVLKHKVGIVLDLQQDIKKQIEYLAEINIKKDFLEQNRLLMNQNGDRIIDFLEKVRKNHENKKSLSCDEIYLN